MRSFGQLTCEAYQSTGRVCADFWRPLNSWIELKAAARYGGKFLGWSGACSGTGTCRFWNGRHAARTMIYASFG
jgi:hypothetical protein